MSLFEQIAAVTKPENHPHFWSHPTAMFNYANSRGRVYDFTVLEDAVRFCKMFGGRFAFSVVAPIDRYIIIVD